MAKTVSFSDAREYLKRDWSVIPMRMADKRPFCRWKPFQSCRPTVSQLEQWFEGQSHDLGIAVIFGAVSGGLASRDFDDMAGYRRWACSHPELAERLPTVATHRGMHVYCTAHSTQVHDIRTRIGKPDAIGAITCTDGELRAGIGCYSVLPPSKHPKGGKYRWEIPLPNGPLPVVDLVASGLAYAIDAEACNRETQRATEAMTSALSDGSVHSVASDISGDSDLSGTSAISAISGLSGDSVLSDISVLLCCKGGDKNWAHEVERAILESIPKRPGKRNEQVFALARALKAIPGLSESSANECKPFVKAWHELAKPVITTQPFEETWIDFLRAWPKVKYAKGAEPVMVALAAARASQEPAVASQFEHQGLRLLVGLCRELQKSAGATPFFLSCRKAGQLLGVDHATASRWLFLLVQERILKIAVRGGNDSRRATRYEYLADR